MAEGLWHLSSLGPQFVGDLQTRIVPEEDWANAWKDYYHVTHIGQRLVIRPSWRDYTSKGDEVVLELDPGMAFGTGLHPTTRMCLEQVEQRTQPGSSRSLAPTHTRADRQTHLHVLLRESRTRNCDSLLAGE